MRESLVDALDALWDKLRESGAERTSKDEYRYVRIRSAVSDWDALERACARVQRNTRMAILWAGVAVVAATVALVSSIAIRWF